MHYSRSRSADIRNAIIVAFVTLLFTSCSGPITDLVGGPSTPEGQPDLTVSWLNTDPPNIGPGLQEIEVSFLVTNIGEVPAAATTTRVAFELEAEPGVRWSAAAEDVLTPPLDKGGTYYIRQALRWDGVLPFGDHRIVVTLDTGAALDQSDTSNDGAEILVAIQHPCTDPNTRVMFADPLLESLVASRLDLPTNSVSCDGLQQLQYLWAGYEPVISLDGIQFAARLQMVELQYSAVTNLSPL